MSDRDGRDRRDERGIVMVMAALMLTALILFGALAVDVGAIWATRAQVQNVDDAVALAAARRVIQQSGTGASTVNTSAARTEGIAIAAAHSTFGNQSVVLRPGDFEFGKWNLQTQAFEPNTSSDPDLVTGVRVKVVLDGAVDTNQRAPAILSKPLGRDGFDLQSTATAFFGFEGDWRTGEFDLPIAIDSCNIVDDDDDADGCGEDFCSNAASGPQLLRFRGGGSSNAACWTEFSTSDSSPDEDDLLDIVRDGSPRAVRAGDSFYLEDNLSGSADDDVIEEIGRYFYGDGRPQQGSDEHSAPGIDSWVVKLPVVECQDGHHCQGRARVTGSVCFEIREVEYLGWSTRQITGKFLCPDSTSSTDRRLYDENCREPDGTGPGGCNFGMRADRAVLVQ